MAYAAYLPMLMEMMQQRGMPQGGGSPFGMNFFNPQGGSPYSSQQGMLGSGMNMGSRMGGIANGLFNLFGAKNPSDAANPFLDQMGGKIDGYMNPFIEAGNQVRPMLQDQYKSLVNDPGAVMNKIGSGFQQSPGYQFNVDQAEGAANRASAAGGMLGSPQQQQNIASTVTGLANQDYGNYMNRGMSMYGQGLGGMSHMNDMSMDASSMAMQAFIQQLMAKAQNAYSGANTSNQQMGGGISSIIGGLF